MEWFGLGVLIGWVVLVFFPLIVAGLVEEHRDARALEWRTPRLPHKGRA